MPEETPSEQKSDLLASVDVEMKPASPAKTEEDPQQQQQSAGDEMPLNTKPQQPVEPAEGGEEAEKDPYESAEPKDILAKFNSAWVMSAVSTKDTAEKL